MSKASPKVDGYIRKSRRWQDVLQAIREIILDSPLTKEVKWRVPCYTFEGRNVVLFGPFKEYCMLNFVKGALLKDSKHILLKPGENTQVSRVIRFTSVEQIKKLRSTLQAYLREAIEVEKSGVKVKLKKVSDFQVPEELGAKFRKLPALKKAFAALTTGRQQAYRLHFSGAKQSQTRAARIEKHLTRILKGKGLLDD